MFFTPAPLFSKNFERYKAKKVYIYENESFEELTAMKKGKWFYSYALIELDTFEDL